MRSMRALLLLVVTLSSLSLPGCGEDPAPGPVTMDAAELERWEIALVEWRIEKNEVFMDPARSPLAERMLDGFEGLDYYFPVPAFRFQVPLVQAAGTDTVMLAKRKGSEVPYVRAGHVRFRHDEGDHQLAVYRATDGDGTSLFLPFYDLTNDETTYPGGRYLELEPTADGTVELDFNKAYNPYCAYDAEAWNCTLPPPENRLPFRVEAGEKLLAGAAH